MTSAPADTSLIPSTSFETTVFQAREQFDAWREYISFVFKVSPVEMPRDDGFLAVAQGFHLGDLVLARTRFEAQRFVRTAQHARVDLLDHYLVQLYTEGGYTGEVDGKPIEVRPGMLSILDLARTTKTAQLRPNVFRSSCRATPSSRCCRAEPICTGSCSIRDTVGFSITTCSRSCANCLRRNAAKHRTSPVRHAICWQPA